MDSPDYTGAVAGRRGGESSNLMHLRALLPASFSLPRLAAPALPGAARVSAPKVCGLCHLGPSLQLAVEKGLVSLQMRDVRPEGGGDLQSEWLSRLEPGLPWWRSG